MFYLILLAFIILLGYDFNKFLVSSKKLLKDIDDDHREYINDTILEPRNIPQEEREEDVAVFWSESPFFDTYKSSN